MSDCIVEGGDFVCKFDYFDQDDGWYQLVNMMNLYIQTNVMIFTTKLNFFGDFTQLALAT